MHDTDLGKVHLDLVLPLLRAGLCGYHQIKSSLYPITVCNSC